MRKLASIQYIHHITEIDGADRIELAHVLGWQCVVQKNMFHIGDLAVYFEIESLLPADDPRYEFLKQNTGIVDGGYRLKTLRFRGEISQGLLLPLDQFPEITDDLRKPDTDVTNLLHVRKYEEEERATDFGTIIGTLPPEVPKTDETRVQNMPQLIDELGRHEYYISTKMDGSSHSVTVNRECEVHVTGHNYEYANDGKSSFYKYLLKNKIIDAMHKYNIKEDLQTLTFQGEFCAPGIQGNPVKLKEPHWYVFTVLIDGKRVGLDKMQEVCTACGAEMVPIEERGIDFNKKYPTVDAVLARADKSMYSSGVKAEGIVIRPVEPCYSSTIRAMLSMKAVSNKYLLKKGKNDV